VFTATQPFKGVENYFNDSLLYQETGKVVKQPLPDDIDNDNEANSELEEDTTTNFAMEPIVAYLYDPDCNNSAENDSEWVINENVAFNYSLYFDDGANPIDTNTLHMPLPTSMTACMHIEDDDGAIFIVPSSKEGQLPIVFYRVYPKTFTFVDSKEDLVPHYSIIMHD